MVALALGGVLAGLVAAKVGVLPHQQEAFDNIRAEKGSVELFLGARDGDHAHLRAPWAVVAWPVAALVAFFRYDM